MKSPTKIRCIIVEDDSRDSEDLKNLLAEVEETIDIIAVCTNLIDAVKAINEMRPLLVFMDIEMNGQPQAGFEIINRCQNINFEVIFTTRHIDRNLREIRRCGLHYIAKPYLINDLQDALSKFYGKADPISFYGLQALKGNLAELIKGNTKICVKSKGKEYFFYAKNIICFKSDNNHSFCRVKLEDGTVSDFKNTMRISEWEKIVGDINFFRCHSRTLINLMNIRYIDIKPWRVKMIDGTSYSVSDQNVEPLKNLLEKMSQLKYIRKTPF